MPLVGEPEEFIEPVPKRMKLRLSAKVPFADQAVDVADVSQQFGQCLFVARQTDSGQFVVMPDGVEFVAESVLVSAGNQPCAGGAAKRPGDVAVGETYAVGRNGIDVRGRYFGIALTAQFAVTKIVRKQDDDVGFAGLRLAKRGEAKQQPNELGQAE